ncbi:MAG TPA: EAL domain-containing protein [Gammaproteobacteria bacterium]|jgi:diguanylate cyclase (GGDEF)-like protein/PAS domain S-box-containing protein|nr:EAL domain-containing protein [Gammaproteobacteria bacterium]
MTQLLDDPIVALAAVLLLLLVVALVWAASRRPFVREIERLKEDLHHLLAAGQASGRIAVNGRASEFVDISASMNRLLDRADEALAAAALPPAEPPPASTPLFDALAETLPEVALIHTNTILFANRAGGELFGVDAGTLVGKPITDLLRPAYRALMRKHTSLIGTEEALAPFEVQLISGDEQGLWAELHSKRIVFNGEPALLTVARDITHRKSLEASLGRSKLQARITLESIGEGVITTDRNGTIDYMNEAAEQLVGVNRASGIGRRLPDILTLVDEVDRTSLGDPVAKCLSERRRVNLGRRAFLLSKGADREFSTELTASPIRGPDGQVAGCVVIFHDVSELRGLAREMSYQASHDALTGLVNRTEFERRLEAALDSARGEGVSHVVCYLDLDRFKLVNDTAGHIAGDNLLREIASLIKQRVRDSDTVARVGGDEFAMLLAGCPIDKARQIADDVCQSVASQRFAWQDHSFDVGVSVGLVEVTKDSGSAESVLSAADSACYVAKQQGRGRIHVYSSRDEVVARERGEIQWLQRLQRALKENGFELYVQPIIALGGRGAAGPAAEILLRMRDESGAAISPAHFLASAERYQLMSHIDRWVVQASLTALAGGAPHVPAGRTCNINLSAQTLGDEDFLEFVVDVLDHTGVNPERICFEARESAVVSQLDHAQRFINVLHGIGCKFALDNFGSGIGSFSNLKNLSLDYVKIDGTYTRNLEDDSVNREMVAAMVKLARSLDFQVVAEQVEDQESFEALRALGVDFVQGFVVEKPRPLAAVH